MEKQKLTDDLRHVINAAYTAIKATGFHPKQTERPTKDFMRDLIINEFFMKFAPEDVLERVVDRLNKHEDYLPIDGEIPSRLYGLIGYLTFLAMEDVKNPPVQFNPIYKSLTGQRKEFRMECIESKIIPKQKFHYNDSNSQLLLKFKGKDLKDLVVTSFYSGKEDFNEGEVYNFKATVKSYREYQGSWSIVVNRLSLVKEK